MQSDGKLTSEAAALGREHAELLARLPATVHAFILIELQKWPTLFVPEQRYQRVLLQQLSGLPARQLADAAGGIARVETDAGVDRLNRRDPGRLQDEAQALLRKQRLVAAWRKEVDAFFQTIGPAIERVLYPPDAPRRLVVQIYGRGIAVQPHTLWSRFKGTGMRIPLKLEAAAPNSFLKAVFGMADETGTGAPLFGAAGKDSRLTPADSWIIECHEQLHQLFGRGAENEPRAQASSDVDRPGLTALSYDRLAAYRDELMRSLYKKILAGVESPQAFAAYARSLKLTPAVDPRVQSSDAVQAFVRDVFLTGNGTLFVNNTFVEWTAVQALRRAQPRILVTCFGVRDRLKPFSSLVLFSQPRQADQIPLIEDPVGSFVDVEQLSYYVWLNAEKSPAYRKKTLYLFLAEGIEEMLALRSDVTTASAGPASSLADVHATMARWLGVPVPGGAGQPITPLIG